VRHALPAGSILANARFAPVLHVEPAAPTAESRLWRSRGRVVAVRLDRDLPVASLEGGTFDLASLANAQPAIELEGWWIDEVWDVVRHLPAMLDDDLRRLAAGDAQGAALPRGAVVLGEHPVRVDPRATVEPHVILDASGGPIRIDEGAKVHAFTRLQGPCYVGPHSTIMGGDVSVTSVGAVCKVRGEVSNTIFAGYANKGHDGFVGHSYLGRWVNLGASTVTSNLKNTYGTVALSTPRGLRDTGMQFLGTLFGDHAKTGIGLRLTTGTVLGAGANVYGNMPPKVVAPFAWGDSSPYSTYRLDKFLEVAERMMSRRHVALIERARRQLSAAYEARWTVERGSEQ
jgi:UDP-N-acetylglucosamine diphosphorylase / glucose-1-phosphate thymidylyltransferase / UDP-N-acetylgalactosamine diphosphorylase / glucosamine-1-phosphate N-acetyltransferase / galactosamine-1-phosphate N-acetyltransferase